MHCCTMLGLLIAGAVVQLVDGSKLSDYHIVLASNASKEEHYAASVIQVWGSAVAGRELQITTFGPDGPELHAARNTIAVGYRATVAQEHNASLEEEVRTLGLEGWLISARDGQWAITGSKGAPRGAIYGAHAFVESVLGVRFLAPNVTLSPNNGSDPSMLQSMHRVFIPPFEMRDMNNAQSEGLGNEPWSVAVGDNGQEFGDTERKAGGGILYADPPGAVHTSWTLVPPSVFNNKSGNPQHFHPEWFAGGQLCWLAPGLKEHLAAIVPTILRSQPNATIISISQNDDTNYCKTGADQAAALEEGSPSAPMLRAVNFVADAIKDEFPGVAIDTLAYQYTRPAPNKTKPRDNVIVRLCSIECNFLKPLTDQSNEAFTRDIINWNKISDRLYIWDYAVDFHAWLLPWPNYFVLAPNMRFFAAHGVKGIFEEGNYKSYGGDLEAMKSYLMTKLMMDPSLNETEVMKDFLQGWYGPKGAPIIMAYMQAFYESALATNTYLSIFLGVAPTGTAPGSKPPPNPGKAVCAQTPKNMCTSGCPVGGECTGTCPPGQPDCTCNECTCNEKGTMCPCDSRHAPNCGTSDAGDYLSAKLIIESATNMTAALHQIAGQEPYHSRMEEAQLSSWFVLLLRWEEMHSYAQVHDIPWPVSEDRLVALNEFARIYRANGLDKGADPVSAGQDWGLNEHTAPPQLPCFAENVMQNGSCRVV